MKKIGIGLVMGLVVGFLAGNVLVSSASVNLAKDAFYKGMTVFCLHAPAQAGVVPGGPPMYYPSECDDMIQQAKHAGYFEQTLNTPVP